MSLDFNANPFSTRFIKPGAIRYQFPEGVSAETLVARLKSRQWRGAIVGPHGSGKSTLVALLKPLFFSAERQLIHIQLHDGQRSLPSEIFHDHPLTDTTLIIIDGYEQLHWAARLHLRWVCWRSSCGLLVTAHTPVRLPMLFETQTSEDLAHSVVHELINRSDYLKEITPADIQSAFLRQQGNLREMLFDLYDLYENKLLCAEGLPIRF